MKRPGPPKGTESYAITDEWRTEVQETMKRRGLAQKTVAEKVGLTEGGLSKMLKPLAQDGPRRSAFAAKVAAYVGVSLPRRRLGDKTEDVIEALAEIEAASPPAFEQLADHVLALRAELRRVLRRGLPKRPKPNDSIG